MRVFLWTTEYYTSILSGQIQTQLPQNSQNPWNGNVSPQITFNRITMHYFHLQKTKVLAIQISHTRFSRLEVIFVAPLL